VFVLQAGDHLARRDPPVALPVDADEDVTLIEIRPIEVARRMRPGTELEQDGRQVQMPDGILRGGAFLSELSERGADEDAHALIGCANDTGGPPISHSHHPLNRAIEPVVLRAHARGLPSRGYLMRLPQ